MIFKLLLNLELWTLKFRPIKFRKWARLEDKKKQLKQAVEDSAPNLQRILEDYLSTAFDLPVDLSRVFWQDSVKAFFSVASVSHPNREIPLIESNKKPKTKDDPWEYSERSWYLYANILANAYGWDYDAISVMEIDDALALIQEILVDDQLEKEFQWSLSEVAYRYDKTTKKSDLVPLHRPEWMLPKFTPSNKKTRIPKSLLPIGNTVDLVNEIEKTHLRADVEGISTSETSIRE